MKQVSLDVICHVAITVIENFPDDAEPSEDILSGDNHIRKEVSLQLQVLTDYINQNFWSVPGDI